MYSQDKMAISHQTEVVYNAKKYVSSIKKQKSTNKKLKKGQKICHLD